MDVAPAKANCSIMARHGGNGFAAAGRVAFVAAVAIGNGISNAIQANADYNDCMLAQGFQIDDGKSPRAQSDSRMLASEIPTSSAQDQTSRAGAVLPMAVANRMQVRPTLIPTDFPVPGVIFASRENAAARRAVDSADRWMSAQDVLVRRSDRKSRDLYLVLCGAGDDSACAMGLALTGR